MNLLELILLSIALGVDCFTVSVTCGLIQKRPVMSTMISTALMFGLFQALMPLLGWLGISFFSDGLGLWDHWIAFGLLALIGGKMIIDGLNNDSEERHFDPSSLTVTLTLAIATSIDAFAVGLSFGCLGMNTLKSILLPLFIIGVGSFIMSVAGYFIGNKLERLFKFPIEIAGGVILIGIGIKILTKHLLG